MAEQIDVVINESGSESNEANNMSDADMDNYFKEAQADESNQPQENANEQQPSEELRSDQRTEEPSESSERESEPAESSSEEGREERSTEQLQADEEQVEEKHERSYKVALKEERTLRQQMQTELQEQREASKKMSEAFNKLVEAADPKQAEPSIPNYEDDPIGNLNAKLEQANQKIEGLSKSDENTQQQTRDQQNMQKFMGDYNERSNEFAKDQPDYMDAYKHLVGEIKQDYMAQGMTERQAIDAANNAEIELAAKQMMGNINPAKTIYDMAKRRGYTHKVEVTDNDNSKAMDKMERLERGVKASRSITTKGESPNDRMTLEEISELNDKDFAAVDWKKVLKMG